LLHLAFDLPKSLQATTNYLQEHAIRKGLAFDVIREPGFPQFVLGDVQRMQQAVANLIVNSIQYTDHGNIEIHLGVVSATPEKCTVKVIVSDTGIGLSERELDQLFQEFEQVPDEESEKDESSEEPIPSVEGNAQPKPSKLGLGLALVARYIKHSNGQIRGRSQPGVGSTFSLEIPFDLTSDVPSSLNLSGTSSANARKSENGGRSRDSGTGSGQLSATHRRYQRPGVFGHRKSEGQSSSASSTKHRSRTPSQNDLHRAVDTRLETAMVRDNLTIIVAEDNSVNSAILSRRLSKMGHKVKVCRDGQQCLDAVLDDLQGVDFVLMDINVSTSSLPFLSLKLIPRLDADGRRSTSS
jgi:CheY-like chemotaxis protein